MFTTPVFSTTSPPSIRGPWSPPPEPLPDPTLRAIYERHYRPRIELRAGKTQGAYVDAITHWERYSGDPPVSRITSELLGEFQTRLTRRMRRGRPISTATVDKTFRHLRPVIDLCMPRDRCNPRGLGLIDYLEYPRTLTRTDPKPKRFTLDELDRLYRACEVARWPAVDDTDAPTFWRAAIVCLYNLGPRCFDLFKREWSDVRWSWEDGLHPYGSIEFQATKTRKQQRIPFNAVVQAHLRSIHKPRHRKRLFPKNWHYGNSKTIRRTWGLIEEAAGVPHQPIDVLRDTCDTAMNRVIKGVGDWILGHGTRGVNARNYYDPTDEVFEAVLKLPQPPAFSELLGLSSDLATREPMLARLGG